MQPRLRPALLLSAALALTSVVAPAAADASTTDPSCAPSTTDSSRVVCTYTTAGEHTFTVPAGVSSLQVDAVGAAGGRSLKVLQSPGGRGGEVTGTVAVPADTRSLLVRVGGRGTEYLSDVGTSFNGGGTSFYGGGGGGASDVRTSSDLSSRLIVAGGGGGGGVYVTCSDSASGRAIGGAGGDVGSPGAAGTTVADCPLTAPAGGAAGTSTGGGAGGATGLYLGFPGALGIGGDGGGSGRGGGGGGGGGWYGGGGGAAGLRVGSGGGGGGSSYVPSGGTDLGATSKPASVTISYTVPQPTDGTPPVITPSVDGTTPKPTTAWYEGSPTLSFTVSDPQSAVSSRAGCDPVTVSTDGAAQSFTCTATSEGGTSSSAVTINRDATAPTVAFDTGGVSADGGYVWGTTPAAPTCTATDATSGVSPAGCVVSGYSTDVGLHTLTATATDNAGNPTVLTRDYTVTPWTTPGFSQPVDMGGVVNTVKGGATVPVKFTLYAGTKQVTDPTKVSFAASKVSCASGAPTDAVESTTTGATGLRYDAAAGQFVYHWQTPKAAGSCYKLTMTTADGSKTGALFQLR